MPEGGKEGRTTSQRGEVLCILPISSELLLLLECTFFNVR